MSLVADPTDALPDWEKLLAAERHVQALILAPCSSGGLRRRSTPRTRG